MLEHEALAILVSAHGVGYAHREYALSAAGSALAVIEDPYAFERELTKAGVLAVRSAVERSDSMLREVRRSGAFLIGMQDEQYPPLLRHIAQPPHLLFCLGNPDLSDALPVAVVGTRRASEYGVRHTRRISRELAGAGACVVSGLALGIDAQAHLGALDAGGRTVAVLGGALDKFYPMDNWQLMQRIVQSGGSVISEYAPGTAPNRYSFLKRNRIIAGMSLGTLVTEGPMRSGALRTANCALDEGREVFALPGDVDRENAALPNYLIAQGAHPVSGAKDILEQLGFETRRHEAPPRVNRKQKETDLPAAGKENEDRGDRGPEDEMEKAIIRILREGETDFDTLSERTGMASEELGAALMMLELDGWITAQAGCRYRLA